MKDKKIIKKGWEKRFDKMWFAPKNQTTIMNWSGIIKGNDGILDIVFGRYTSAEETEQQLKETLADVIKDFIRDEIQEG